MSLSRRIYGFRLWSPHSGARLVCPLTLTLSPAPSFACRQPAGAGARENRGDRMMDGRVEPGPDDGRICGAPPKALRAPHEGAPFGASRHFPRFAGAEGWMDQCPLTPSRRWRGCGWGRERGRALAVRNPAGNVRSCPRRRHSSGTPDSRAGRFHNLALSCIR